jgi:hypothetical protein
MPDRAPQRLIADRYALVVPIGQGGMGVVWRARDNLLGREVAIKEVRLPATIPDGERSSMRARVLREARAAALLNHPAAVTLYDVINEQGHAFIVMELISAPTLAQVVAKDGPLEPARAARIGAQVAAALAAAHQAGIVHRDVKPANVMVVRDGARLTDFGIARVKGDPKLTSTGLIIGSPAYMAPEQASGAAAGPEADLWSLGATLYYAVEGRPPFEREGQIAVLAAVVNDHPRTPRRAGELAPIIATLLSKDPQRRPTASALRADLERLATRAPLVDASSSAGAGPAGDIQEPTALAEAPPAGSGGTTHRAPAAAEPGAAGSAGAEAPGEEAARVQPVGAGAPGEEAARVQPAGAEAPGEGLGAGSAGDTEQLPELDDLAPAAPAPPPGKPSELTRRGPTRPGHQGPAHVRPDQPARPERATTAPPRGHPSLGPTAGDPGSAGAAGLGHPGASGSAESRAGAGRPQWGGQPPRIPQPAEARAGGVVGFLGLLAHSGLPAARAVGRRLTAGRLPLVLALVALAALLAASLATSNVLRGDRGGSGAAAPAQSRANRTTKPGSATTQPPRAPSTTETNAPPGQPSGVQVPAGWITMRHPAGAYALAYPRGWRAAVRSDTLNTTTVSGPGGRLLKVQSSSSPGDPMQAWTDLEQSFSSRPGYRRIRLEPGRYKGLDAAVWEFTQLEGGQRVHKLDITFKSADGRWGYAVLLQASEADWSGAASLAGEFEQAFAPIG